MKIVLATPIYPPEIGGPATYTKELCERLRDTHDITVIAFTDVREAFPGTKLVPVSKHRPLPIRLVKYFFAVWKISKGKDLIYVQNAMASGLPVALVSKLRKIPFVLKFVGDEAWERATQLRQTNKRLEEFLANPDGNIRIRMMIAIQGFVLRQASIVTTPSAYLRDELVKAYGVKNERAVVNYNAAEETERLPFEVVRVSNQIATTARLVAWKGVAGIIRATAMLSKKIPDIKFFVAGEGPEFESLKGLAKELDIENRVVFMGKISRAETWRLRKQSSVYVLNSSYEGLPHTVLTSFAAEIPTVATNISGTNEAIYHEDTGLLVEPGDDGALANAIERLLKDRELQEKIVKNGTKLLKDKFSWESHLKVLNGFFERAAREPAK